MGWSCTPGWSDRGTASRRSVFQQGAPAQFYTRLAGPAAAGRSPAVRQNGAAEHLPQNFPRRFPGSFRPALTCQRAFDPPPEAAGKIPGLVRRCVTGAGGFVCLGRATVQVTLIAIGHELVVPQFHDKSSGIWASSWLRQPPLFSRIFRQSCSGGVSKTNWTDAGKVSHALRFSSLSSWPELQPA